MHLKVCKRLLLTFCKKQQKSPNIGRKYAGSDNKLHRFTNEKKINESLTKVGAFYVFSLAEHEFKTRFSASGQIFSKIDVLEGENA